MVSLGIIFYFCSYEAQENIKNIIFYYGSKGGIAITYTILGIPYYNYSRIYPTTQTLSRLPCIFMRGDSGKPSSGMTLMWCLGFGVPAPMQDLLG